MKCLAEFCPNWSGDGCVCAVLQIEPPTDALPCPCDCSCDSLGDCLRLADEQWPDPPHWPSQAHRLGICCDDSGMIANPSGNGLVKCPGTP